MNLLTKEQLAEMLQRAEMAAEVTLPVETFRDLVLQAAMALVPQDGRCEVCGQKDDGQTGEHPCEYCGLPLVHDDSQSAYERGYKYLQMRLESIGYHGWAHDMDDDIRRSEKITKS